MITRDAMLGWDLTSSHYRTVMKQTKQQNCFTTLTPQQCKSVGTRLIQESLLSCRHYELVRSLTSMSINYCTYFLYQNAVLKSLHVKTENNWMALWKNRISSTTMKLRKSLVKPVTWQNISSCLVLQPEIVLPRRINVILWTSADICVVVQDDLGWKNQTTRYNCRFSAASLALRVIFVRRKCLPIYASCCTTISGGRTQQHIIGFGELAAVD